MRCRYCGTELNKHSVFCGQCGKKIKKEINKKQLLKYIIFSFLLLVIILIISIILKPDRKKVLDSLVENEYYKFTIDGENYYLGEKISKLNNGLSYDTNFGNIVYGDSITTRTFFNQNNDAKFLGVLYCSSNEECDINNTSLVKVNFYNNSNVIVNDFIKIGVTYDEIIKKYGKENGYFYQDKDMLVWSLGEKVGDPYYVLKFTKSLFFGNKLSEIRIGVWWYDGEYDHTVIKDNVGKVEK